MCCCQTQTSLHFCHPAWYQSQHILCLLFYNHHLEKLKEASWISRKPLNKTAYHPGNAPRLKHSHLFHPYHLSFASMYQLYRKCTNYIEIILLSKAIRKEVFCVCVCVAFSYNQWQCLMWIINNENEIWSSFPGFRPKSKQMMNRFDLFVFSSSSSTFSHLCH